jgi:hypothetical protein
MTNKKQPLDPTKAADWLKGGRTHRPEHQKTKAKNETQQAQNTEARTGRPRSFEGIESDRLNLLLPAYMVEAIRIRALKEKKTPGELVAEFLEPTFPKK